jgi:hypothetical protein
LAEFVFSSKDAFVSDSEEVDTLDSFALVFASEEVATKEDCTLVCETAAPRPKRTLRPIKARKQRARRRTSMTRHDC